MILHRHGGTLIQIPSCQNCVWNYMKHPNFPNRFLLPVPCSSIRHFPRRYALSTFLTCGSCLHPHIHIHIHYSDPSFSLCSLQSSSGKVGILHSTLCIHILSICLYHHRHMPATVLNHIFLDVFTCSFCCIYTCWNLSKDSFIVHICVFVCLLIV